MSKRKNKKEKNEYEVGYCKPPEEYKWKKGCKSPNPSGRPKKIKNLQEALQLSLNKEVNTKDANGVVKKSAASKLLQQKPLLMQFQKTDQQEECFIEQIYFYCNQKKKIKKTNKSKKSLKKSLPILQKLKKNMENC